MSGASSLWCPTHPDYQIKKEPTSACVTCHRMWQRRHARRICHNPACKRVFVWNNDSTTRFCSLECSHSRFKPADPIAAAERQLKGNGTEFDRVKQDNTELKRDLDRARSVIGEYQQRTSFEDKLLDNITEYIEKTPYRPQFTPFVARKGTADDHEMLANVSDAHYPEAVDPDQTFGIRYNATVCKYRMEYLRDKIIRYKDLREGSYPIRKLTVNVNGDMLSGDIHEELEVTNQKPMSEALVDMAYMLHDMGLAFAESFPAVEFIVMPGNHPRLTKKPRFKQKWNNWEHVMGKFLQALAHGKFQVTVPKDLIYRFNIFDKVIGVTHGDGQKAASYAGIPWYGMKQRQDALQSLLKSLDMAQLDLLCYGHFHRLIWDEGQGCSLLINGSIKGGDEFSTGTRYQAQAPVQALLTFHPKHGVTDISRINLGHI